MAKSSTRKISVPAKPVSTKPVATLPSVSPVTAAAVTKPVAPEAKANAEAIVAAAAKPPAHITRTAATIAKQATNFGSLSDRDTAYLGFYRRLASTLPGHVVTVAAIVACGQRPPHIGSNKPHDAGVIVRGIKAGIYAATDTTGHAFTITELGQSTKAA